MVAKLITQGMNVDEALEIAGKVWPNLEAKSGRVEKGKQKEENNLSEEENQLQDSDEENDKDSGEESDDEGSE